MLELTLLLTLIATLFLGIAWLDKKKDIRYSVNFGVILIICFFIVLACLVERIINFLLLKIC